MEHPVTSIQAGRKFANDDERRKVMLERARPQLDLQQRVTDLEAQLAAQTMDYNYFLSLKEAHDELARFIRENYAEEIDRKEPQHRADAVTAILHYARRERKLRPWMRWLVDRFL